MKKLRVLALLPLNILLVSSAIAAPQYWDPGTTGPTTGGSSGGNGNWDTTSSLWYDGISADSTWVNGDDAYFTNTAGTVTLTTSLSAGNIYFTNAIGNYYITNATGAEQLTVNNTIDTGTNEETIAAPVDNSGTLNINGTGRLHLPVANNINNVNLNGGALSIENNTSVNGNVTVANGAALEFNGTTNNFLNNVGTYVTINGTGINSNGAINNVSGLTTFYGQITLGANNSEIYVGTNAAFIYWGSDNNTPLTDNGNNYNLLIGGPVGNVQFADFGPQIGGSMIIEPGASCYMYVSGSAAIQYTNSYVGTNGTLFAQADNGLGSIPFGPDPTNIVLDGGRLIGYGTWFMNGYRGIMITTNGGTIADTDASSGSDWYTGNIISSNNAPLTVNSSGGTIRIGGATNNANLNIGMGTLTFNGGNAALSYLPTSVTPIYSNLVDNGCTLTFNYDSGGGNSQLGSVPSAFSQSNIWLNGGQFHVGHSTTISANRGIYVGPSGTTLNEVTTTGTATWGSIISGPGSITFATATHVLAANNTYTGNTTINGSTTLKVGNNGATGALGAGNTTDSGTLSFNRTGTYSYSGVISGTGSVLNASSGVITLTGKNTYGGGTTISAGTLLLNNPTGSSGTGTGAVHVNSGGAIGGTGTISGTVGIASGGLLSLLTNTLTINNNLIVTGNVSVVVNKSFTQPNGEAVISSSFMATNGGTGSVTITNLGPALAVGDKFTLFSQAVVNGGNMSIKVAGSTGYTLANNLAVDGSVSVTAVPPPPKPVINNVQVSNGNFIFSGTNGTSGDTYNVLTSTNLTLQLSQWISITNGVFPANGNFSITNPINPGNPQLFYLLQVQ